MTMDWWQLVIALFVITVYVVKHILAAQQEQPKARGQRQWVKEAVKTAEPSKSDEDVARDRTELDRRIEEVQERRRDLEGAKPTASPMPRRSIPMAVPTVISPPRYQPRTDERSPPAAPKPRGLRTAPPRLAIPTVQRVPTPAVLAAGTLPSLAAGLAERPVSPAVRQVLELLNSRDNLAVAVILREILDRPMSLRRRR